MTVFSVWAPDAGRVDVEVSGRACPLSPVDGRPGWWAAEADAPAGTDYAFRLDGGDPLADPRSPRQPYGPHGVSRTYDHGAFAWRDARWHGAPLAGAVIYELHVGTFTPEGTLDAAAGRLDHLVSLGVTIVELMPVAAFPGEHGWGYDGIGLWAVHEPYGGPDALKRFVSACHERGLGVFLDVVYNHVGPGNKLASFGPYFTDVYSTPWGPAVNLDQAGSDAVRSFIVDNALMWLRDYHLDGLRLDAVHAFQDHRAVHLLEELAAAVDGLSASCGRSLVLVAESDMNNPRLITPRPAGGYGLTGQWDDDFHHTVHALVTGERQGYYGDFGAIAGVAKVLAGAYFHDGTWSSFRQRTHGRPVDTRLIPGYRFVVFDQDHDQVGNRALGDRLPQTLAAHPHRDGLLRIAAGLVLTAPFTPMLFMGEEWGADTPWQFFTDHTDPFFAKAVSNGRRSEFAAHGWGFADVPDPQDPETFLRSKLDWSQPSGEPYAALLGWYRCLLALRRARPELTDPRLDRVRVRYDEAARWLVVHRGTLRIAANFGDSAVELPVTAPVLVLGSGPAVAVRGDAVILPAASFAIVETSSLSGWYRFGRYRPDWAACPVRLRLLGGENAGARMQPLGTGDPRQIGRYQLICLLGQGGMGRVYLGHSPAGVPVAVKIIQPQHASDQNFLVRFRREVKAAKQVNGAYTAAVLEADPNSRPPWLVTEFVPGPSLAEAVTRVGALPLDAVWRLSAGLVEALKAVHECGLVHRDLKPANVLLAANGPKVIDFGISKALGSATNATLPSVTVPGGQPGTPGFMAPEQRFGFQAGPPSDVYAFGKVIAFAATGSIDVVNSIGTDIRLQAAQAARRPEYDVIPLELREFVASCLSFSPDDRPTLGQLMDTVLDKTRRYPQASALRFWREPLASVIRYKMEELSRQLGEEPEARTGRQPHTWNTTTPSPPRAHPPTQLSGDGPGGGPRGTKPLAGDGINFQPTQSFDTGPGPYGTKRFTHFTPPSGQRAGRPDGRDQSSLSRGLSGTLFAAYRPRTRAGRRVGGAKDAAAYALDGDAAFEDRRFPEARNAYRASLELDPKNAVVLVDLGRTYCALQQLMPAETSFLQALELDDLLIAAHRNRYVAVDMMMGRQPELAAVRGEAEAACEAVLAAEAQDPTGLANLGDAYCCLSRYGEAVSAYERALGMDADDPRLTAKRDYARRQGR